MRIAIMGLLAVLALTACEDEGSNPGYCEGHPNNTTVCDR